MKHRTRALLTFALATAIGGCAPPPASGTPPPGLPSPTAVDAGVAACTADQVGLTTSRVEGAAGTTYITVRASLVGGEPCKIRDWPSVAIDDADAAAIAEAPADPTHTGEIVTLSTYLDFNLGWASWCIAPPARPLNAQIGLLEDGSAVSVALPDDYAPSGCLGASTIVSIAPAS